MPSDDALPELPEGVRLERLPPASRRVRFPPPEWAVWLGPDRIGMIEQWRVPSASATSANSLTRVVIAVSDSLICTTASTLPTALS